jgi:hypothetical protein
MPKIKDIEIYDQKKNLKIDLMFKKEVITFQARIVSHLNRIYELDLAFESSLPTDSKGTPHLFGPHGYMLTVTDSEVDRVDATEHEGIYKFFMVTGQNAPPKEVLAALQSRVEELKLSDGMPCNGAFTPSSFYDVMFKMETLDYDAQYLTDELFDFIKKGMKKYGMGDKTTVKPYFPLAYVNVAYLMGKIYGEAFAAALVNHPATDFLAFVWLSGYAMQSSLKKSGVSVESTLTPVSPEKIEELREKYLEFMKKLAHHFEEHQSSDEKYMPEDEDDDDQTTG